MEAKDTDIFISYRRVDGRDVARTIQLALGKAGFENVFFDYTSMREGMFNEQITTAINNCKDFILVLSVQSMLRCANPDDWVAKEIQMAIDAGCKIIPVQVNDPFDAWPIDFPKKFNFIKQLEFLTLRTDEYFEDSIRRLIGWLDSKPTVVKDEDKAFTLCIKVDETCELYVNDVKWRKIKGGKIAEMTDLTRGQLYSFKFVSLARKDSEITISYTCPGTDLQRDNIDVSFVKRREEEKQKLEQERTARVEAKDLFRQQERQRMLACEGYDECSELFSSMVRVKLNGKFGFINEEGFESVTCEYDDAEDFRGDYATVCKNGKWGIIDKIGQIIVPMFSDTPCSTHGDFEFFVSSKNNRYAISALKNGVPSNFPYEHVLILIAFNHLFAVKQNSLWTIVDATGAPSPFTTPVKAINGTDTHFEELTENYLWSDCFTVQHPRTERWGYLNSQLKLTIPFVDEVINHYGCGFENRVIRTNGYEGLVNIETGKYIIPAVYDYVGSISYEYSDFYKVHNNAVPIAVYDDISSREAMGIELADLQHLWKELVEVRQGCCFIGGRQGVMDINGNVIVPQRYQFIEIFHNHVLAYVLKDLQFVLDKSEYFLSVKRNFNKTESVIDIYTFEGNCVAKLPYTNDDDKILEVIRTPSH